MLIQFVVDENGEPELTTIEVLRSTHAQFTRSVVRTIPRLRVRPAEHRGRRVRQLVQQPFHFAFR